MQVKIQVLIAGGVKRAETERGTTGSNVGGVERAGTERGTTGSNVGPQIEVAKPLIFNREVEKVGGFIMTCRLYLRIKMRKSTVSYASPPI